MSFVFVLSWFFASHVDVFPGQGDICLESWCGVKSGVVFFAPHGDESVANDYVAQKVVRHGGTFLVLKQSGERHIRLLVGNVSLSVDPNRIFTGAGVTSSLLKLNSWVCEDDPVFLRARQRAISLGQFILARILQSTNGDPFIVAVHNNTNGYDGDGDNGIGTVSIERYALLAKSGAGFIKSIHQGRGDEDDLFFLTREEHFSMLKNDHWNLVLQHPQVAFLADEDDGSLSVWAEMAGLPYVNIEAERTSASGYGEDHLNEQVEMVDYLFNFFNELGLIQ